MKFATVLGFASLALAAPSQWKDWKGSNSQKNACLSVEDALHIVDLSRTFQLKADYAAAKAAGEYLFAAVDYKEYGDSINALRGDPYGTLVEANGTIYVENVLSAPPLAGIDTNAVVNNCTHIIWHYTFYGVGGPMNVERVKGFSLIGVEPWRAVQPVVFQQVEFNSFAWAQNTGFNITFPTGGEYGK